MKRMNVNSEYMKKIIVFWLLACAFACTGKKAEVEIIVHNFSSLDRENEIVEMDTAVIGAFRGERFVLCDSAGRQIPYQVTYDGKVIFPASVKAGGNAKYRITAATTESDMKRTAEFPIPQEMFFLFPAPTACPMLTVVPIASPTIMTVSMCMI